MKICSLLPSGTEILFALGLDDQVAGVSDLCDFPPGALSKPVVSRSKVDPSVLTSEEVEEAMNGLLARGENPYALDQEWLVRESPDVILTQDLCHVCEVDAGQVSGVVAGMDVQPEVVVLQPRTLDDVLESIIQIGLACGASEVSESFVESLRRRMATIAEGLANVASRPRVFSIEGVNPLVIGGHWIPDLLRLAGGEHSIFEPGCSAARLDWEQVREYAPEKLFIDLCSSDLARNLREAPWLAGQDGWGKVPAVANGEVYLIDHLYFSRPGPRVIGGLEILAQLTHPEVFSGLVPPSTVVKLDLELAQKAAPEDFSAYFLPYPPNPSGNSAPNRA